MSYTDEFAEEDKQDLGGDLTGIEQTQQQVIPQASQDFITSKDSMEKIARFFASLPGTDYVKDNFFGFLNQHHQFGFYGKEDLPLLMLMYDRAESSYMNSIPSWKWTRQHTQMLNNIYCLYFSLVRQSIGTKEDVMNQRLALNSMRIQRMFGETTPRRNKFLGII